MADIDITELLDDPDLAGETFTVRRRQQVISSKGRASVSATDTANVVGAIYPTGQQSLTRQEAFQSQAKSITVVTKHRLRGTSQQGGNDYYPDLVICALGTFVVRSVNDMTNYGPGIIVAECVSQELIDAAPA